MREMASGDTSAMGLTRSAGLLERIHGTFRGRTVGQGVLYMVFVTSLPTREHVLLGSVTGLAKTAVATMIASAMSGIFSRIQYTPDLMPSDIVGTQTCSYETDTSTTQLKPIRANAVLPDETNRPSTRTQSTMFKTIQEGQTSIRGTAYELPRPLTVMATQNPIGEGGAYILPEARMDRFLIKEASTYPKPVEKVETLTRTATGIFNRKRGENLVTTEDILFLQNMVQRVYIDDTIKEYVAVIVSTIRSGEPRPIQGFMKNTRMRVSPRGGLSFAQVGQALAFQARRNYVISDDAKQLWHIVLRHCLVRTSDALANDVTPEVLIDIAFNAVPTPWRAR